jgi:hypothetical protein
MPETLLTPSTIKLFGRLMRSLTYANDTVGTGLGDNRFLQRQLEANGDNPPRLARIYAFSFEGANYPLARPSIFLVHGDGLWVGDWTTNSSLDQSGVAGKGWDFSGTGAAGGPNDVYCWEYEKGDFSLRLDLEAGPFEQILLAAALRSGADMADRSGQGLGIRSGQGLDCRSGQGLDSRSGQGLRR